MSLFILNLLSKKQKSMKTKLLIILCFIVIKTNAQTKQAVKTVFGIKNPRIGYFINPSCQFGEIAGNTAILPGLGAGVVFNNQIYLGINYKFIASENTPKGEPDNRLYLDQRFYGLKFEYAIQPEKVVHVSFPIELGTGETELDLKDSYEDENLIPTDDAWFCYLEPGVALEINLYKYLKLNLGAEYRFLSDVAFHNLTSKDLSGMNFSIGIKVGMF